MIPIVYIFASVSRSSSIAHLSCIVFSVALLFISYISEEKLTDVFAEDESKLNHITKTKAAILKCLSIFPQNHVYKVIILLLNDQFDFFKKTPKQEYYKRWLLLTIIGLVANFLFFIKIFFLDNINFSFYEKYLGKWVQNEAIYNQQMDEDVLNERKFTNEDSSKKESIMTIKNVHKYYLSFIKRTIVHACNDVNFSLRHNEVILC